MPHEPTHTAGGTLNLVFTKSEHTLDTVVIDPPGILPDHSLLQWLLPLLQPPITVTRAVRSWRKVDTEKFRTALRDTGLCDETRQPDTAEELFAMNDDSLRSLVEVFAPVRKITSRRQRFAGVAF